MFDWKLTTVALATLLHAGVSQQASQCAVPIDSEFDDDTADVFREQANKRLEVVLNKESATINSFLADQIKAQGSGSGNWLQGKDPIPISKETGSYELLAQYCIPKKCINVCIPFVGCRKTCTPEVCTPGCTADYGFGCRDAPSCSTGRMNSFKVLNPDQVKVSFDDAEVCAIEHDETLGFVSSVNSHITVNIGNVQVGGPVQAYVDPGGAICNTVSLGQEFTGTFNIVAEFSIPQFTVALNADLEMNYDSDKSQCKLVDFSAVDFKIPPPTLVSYELDGTDLLGGFLDKIQDFYNLLFKGDLQSRVNALVQSRWKSGDMEVWLEEAAVTAIQKAENSNENGGKLIECYECLPGEAGTPVAGCSEINACINHPCQSNEVCTDKAAIDQFIDNVNGRTCKACDSGEGVFQTVCQACPSGTAGTGGFCSDCKPSNGVFAPTTNLKQCIALKNCPLGTVVTVQPSSSLERGCGPVTEGFTDTVNADSVTPWKTCEPGEFVVLDPTPRSDRVCKPCPTGEFSTEENQQACQAHRTCTKGERIISPAASSTTNRLCIPCPLTYFSDSINSNTCTKHTVCEEGQFTSGAGSRTFDTTCDDHIDCVPGEYETEGIGSNKTRTCGECAEGTFTESLNQEKCAPVLNCSAGTYVQGCESFGQAFCAASTEYNRVCIPCFDETFSTEENSNACIPWTNCASGTFDVSPTGPTISSDRDCEACGNGTFKVAPTRRRVRQVSRTESRRTSSTDTVWLCSSDCAQETSMVEAADTACVALTIDECTEVNYSGLSISTFMDTPVNSQNPDGKFYWMPKRLNNDVQLAMYSDKSCASSITKPTIPVVPNPATFAKYPELSDVFTYFKRDGKNLCKAVNGKDCNFLLTGLQVRLAMDTCGPFQSTFDPSLVGMLLAASVPTFNVQISDSCQPVYGVPSSCPTPTTTPVTVVTTASTAASTTTAFVGCDEATQFKCADVDQCISKNQRCNNELDCDDASDEDDCVGKPTNSLSPTVSSTSEPTTSYRTTTTGAPNTESCKAWQTCSAGEFVFIAGTAASNVDCKSCEQGVSYSYEQNSQRCTEVSNCTPNSTVSAEPTLTSDRECVPVEFGSFTATFNAQSATKWKDCNAGQYIVVNGSDINDRECGDCVVGLNYQPMTNQQSCIAVNPCTGGVRTSPGTPVKDRECEDCAAGKYKLPSWNWATACERHTDCNASYYVSSQPSNSANRECDLCIDGNFSTTINANVCTVGSLCDAGTYLSISALGAADSTCLACGNGTFTNTSNAQRSCTSHSICTDPEQALVQGNASSDVSCGVYDANALANLQSMRGGVIGGIVGGIVAILFVCVALVMYVRGGKTSKDEAADVWESRTGISNAMYEIPTDSNFAVFDATSTSPSHGAYLDAPGVDDEPMYEESPNNINQNFSEQGVYQEGDAAVDDARPKYFDVNPPVDDGLTGFGVEPPMEDTAGMYAAVNTFAAFDEADV